MADPRPLVLLIDEIDALVGDTLRAQAPLRGECKVLRKDLERTIAEGWSRPAATWTVAALRWAT